MDQVTYNLLLAKGNALAEQCQSIAGILADCMVALPECDTASTLNDPVVVLAGSLAEYAAKIRAAIDTFASNA